MNIKVIYKKRTHILQANIQTLAEIRTAIKNIFKEELPEEFALYIQIDPYQGKLQNLETDHKLQQIRNEGQDNSWPSIKILVSDSKDYPIDQNDLDLLNRSVMVNRNQQSKQPEQFQEEQDSPVVQKADTVREFKDAECFNHPVVVDQFQQTKFVENDSKETQSAVTTKDAGQNPQNLMPSLVFPGVDKDALHEYLLQLIDQRLRHHNVIGGGVDTRDLINQIFQTPQQKQSTKQHDTASLESLIQTPEVLRLNPELFVKEIKTSKFSVKQFDQIEWILTVLNTGSQKWPSTLELRCIEGEFIGKSINLPPLESKGSYQIEMKLSPQLVTNQQQVQFKFFFTNEEGQDIPIGIRKYGFELSVMQQNTKKQSITCQNTIVINELKERVLVKAKQIQVLFPQIELDLIVEFIYSIGVETDMDDLIEQCLQNTTLMSAK